MTVIHTSAVVIPELGELGRLPDGGIINAGGVAGPHFTIGGQAVILKDGTASDGSGPVIIVDVSTVGNVIGIEHVQAIADTTWTISHTRGTKKVQVTIWDDTDEQVLPDMVKIIDPDTIQVTFNTAITGRAILMLFV